MDRVDRVETLETWSKVIFVLILVLMALAITVITLRERDLQSSVHAASWQDLEASGKCCCGKTGGGGLQSGGFATPLGRSPM